MWSLMCKMATEILDDERLSKVKIWYRCQRCSGWFYSVPVLKQHAQEEHKDFVFKLPKDLPPEAEKGKIYYKRLSNKIPAPLPYQRHSFLSRDQETAVEEENVTSTIEIEPGTSKKGEELESSEKGEKSGSSQKGGESESSEKGEKLGSSEKGEEPGASTNGEDPGSSNKGTCQEIEEEEEEPVYDIRLRDLSELQEACSSEDDGNTVVVGPVVRRQEKPVENEDRDNDNYGPPLVASPPDSGIIMHDGGSESHDEVTSISSVIMSTQKEKSTCHNNSVEENQPTTSKVATTATAKFYCSTCKKSFNFQSALNFHFKKMHESAGRPKIVLKIKRDKRKAVSVSNEIQAPSSVQTEQQRETNPSSGERVGDVVVENAPSSHNADSRVPEKEFENSVPSSPVASEPPIVQIQSDSSDSEEEIPVRKRRRSSAKKISSSSGSEDSGSASEYLGAPARKKLKRLRVRTRKNYVVDSDSDSSNVIERPQRMIRPSDELSSGVRRSSRNILEVKEEPSPLIRRKSLRNISPAVVDRPPLLKAFGDESRANPRNSPSDNSSNSDDLFIPIGKTKKTKKRKKFRKKEGSGTAEESIAEERKSDIVPPANIGTTVCNKCGLECANGSALVQHIESFHNRKKLSLICGYCKKRYANKMFFNRHIVTHLQPNNLESENNVKLKSE